MQPIIHKAAVALSINPVSVGISPRDSALLVLNPDATVTVLVERPSRLSFGLGSPRLVPIGALAARATDILLPALERQVDLRVRVVEVELPHVARTGRASVFVSVWGNPADLDPLKPKRTVLTRSKINDPMPHPDNED